MKTLVEFIQELKNAGFTIYSADDKKTISWCYFVKGENFGYMQFDDFTGFSFSTSHKPNRKCGTGFRVHAEITEPTIKHCTDCFVNIPYRPDVEKYKNWDEYINSSHGSILKYRKI